jgi:phage-related protein
MNKFEVLFLTEAREFLLGLDQKSRDKIIFNIDKSKIKNDNELFKKLKGEIWEFRTLYNKTYYRIFAFWDKTGKIPSTLTYLDEQTRQTLVLATHGIIKKTGKTPEKEIEKAENIRLKYFELKIKQNEIEVSKTSKKQ